MQASVKRKLRVDQPAGVANVDESEQFLDQVLSGISESEVISIFFPLLRRALVVDTRCEAATAPMVRIMPQAKSMEERISSIEKLRPGLGKIQSILGIPWMRSVRTLRDHGVKTSLVQRLAQAGVPVGHAAQQVDDAIDHLWRIERLGFERMIRGEGYSTIWSAN